MTPAKNESKAPAKGAAKAPAKKASAQTAQPAEPEKKKGLLDRIFGIFGKGKKEPEKKPPS